MVTYSDLIQTGLLVVGIIGLFLAAYKKEVTALTTK
nr:MAG TPA: cytochrome b6 [Bacteriophage sp.]